MRKMSTRKSNCIGEVKRTSAGFGYASAYVSLSSSGVFSARWTASVDSAGGSLIETVF
jgi:hypothetical protein